MRQALVMGAKPILCRNRAFPRVPLGPGGWRIEVENRNTSKLRVLVFRSVTSPEGTALVPKVMEINDDAEPLIVHGPVLVSVEIYEPGREDYVNVHANSLEESAA